MYNNLYTIFSGFFLFCVYTRSPVAGKGVKMLRNASGMVNRSIALTRFTAHTPHLNRAAL